MLVRMRSVTTALLGLIAAIGLGLVAFVSQQGWTDVLDGAIPDPPVELRISQGGSAKSAQARHPVEVGGRHGATTLFPPARSDRGGSTGSGVSGSQPLADAPTSSPGSGGTPGGKSPAAPQPTAQAPAASPSPAAATPPVSAPEKSDSDSPRGSKNSSAGEGGSSSPGNSAFGKSRGKSRSKAEPTKHDDAPVPATPPAISSDDWPGEEEEEGGKDQGGIGKGLEKPDRGR